MRVAPHWVFKIDFTPLGTLVVDCWSRVAVGLLFDLFVGAQRGATGQGFSLVMNFVRKHRPRLVILENTAVDSKDWIAMCS